MSTPRACVVLARWDDGDELNGLRPVTHPECKHVLCINAEPFVSLYHARSMGVVDYRCGVCGARSTTVPR